MSGRTTIEALRILGFGRFSDQHLELDRGLNLLTGPNEAGKSTLLAFIRAILFGFERRPSPSRYEPRAGNAFGGELVLRAPSGTLIVQRTASRRRVEGELSLRDETGQAVAPAVLGVALGGANRELFTQVFAITLDELQDFRALASESSVSEALFAAGMQGAQRLPEAVSALGAQAASLWGERAQKRPLNAALGALATLRSRLDAVVERPERYFEAIAEHEALGREQARAQAELAVQRERERRLERLEQAAGALRQLASVGDAAGAEDGSPEALPRLERLEARRAEVGRSRAVAAAQAAELSSRLAALERAVAGRGSLVSARSALASWQGVTSLARGLDARRAEGLEQQRALEARLLRLLGRAERAEWLASVDAGTARVAELQALRDRETRAVQERTRAEDAVGVSRAERDALERRRTELLASRGASGPSVEAVEAALAALDEFNVLGVKVEQLEARSSTVRERLALLPEPRQPGSRLLLALGVLVALLLAWILAFLLARPASGSGLGAAPEELSGQLFSQLFSPVAGAAVGAAGVVLGLGMALAALRGRRASLARGAELEARRRSWIAEVEAIEAELMAARERRARCRDAAGLEAPSAAPARLQALVWARRRAEAQERLAGELEQLEREMELSGRQEAEAGRRLDAASAALASVRAEVEQKAAVAGLPAGLLAQQALDLTVELSRLVDEWSHLSRQRAALAADEEAVEVAAQRLLQEATRLGLEVGAGAPQASGAGSAARTAAPVVEGLGAALARDEAERVELGHLRARLEEVQASLGRHEAELTEVEGQRDALVRHLGAACAEDVRARAARALEARQEAQRRRELGAEVKAAAGMAPAEAERAIEAEGDVLQALAEARAARAALEASITQAAGRLGQLTERRQAMEADAEAAQLRLEEAACTARVERLATQFAEAALARTLMQRARQRFERANQPRIVQRAQELFAELTDGRYVGLAVDLAGQSLVVHDGQGVPWTVDALSRGTRELLLLAFRLAVVEDFGAARVRLPVVLDDVLVDLDADRAARLVRILAAIGARHQVIAMTCHRHVRGLFEEAGARIVSLGLGVQLSLLTGQGGKGRGP